MEKKMPKDAVSKAQQLLVNKTIADIALQKYLEGVKDGMGLEGDWNLDSNQWVFTPMKEIPNEPIS
mgnify:CR=1 FL=1